MDNDVMAGATLATTWELDLDEVTGARFARLVLERGLPHLRSFSWATESSSLDAVLDRAVTTQRMRRCRAAILDVADLAGGDCLAHLSIRHGRLNLDVAAHRFDAADAVHTAVRELYPVAERNEAQRIGITFWSLGRHGGKRI